KSHRMYSLNRQWRVRHKIESCCIVILQKSILLAFFHNLAIRNWLLYASRLNRNFPLRFFATEASDKTLVVSVKRQCNTSMTEQNRTYERIINRVTDQFVKMTIGQGKEYEKVLFIADPHFLFLIPDAHLAHCLLPANTQATRLGK